MTQRRREGEKILHTEGLTTVSHAWLAVSLAMLCQSFLGTVLTLRDFWQSDYESVCSNAVSAKTWAESPTAMRAWLAVKLQDEEWAAYIKLFCSLLMDALSASWWCQDFVLGADPRTTANTDGALLNYTGTSVESCYVIGPCSRINVGNTRVSFSACRTDQKYCIS